LLEAVEDDGHGLARAVIERVDHLARLVVSAERLAVEAELAVAAVAFLDRALVDRSGKAAAEALGESESGALVVGEAIDLHLDGIEGDDGAGDAVELDVEPVPLLLGDGEDVLVDVLLVGAAELGQPDAVRDPGVVEDRPAEGVATAARQVDLARRQSTIGHGVGWEGSEIDARTFEGIDVVNDPLLVLDQAIAGRVPTDELLELGKELVVVADKGEDLVDEDGELDDLVREEGEELEKLLVGELVVDVLLGTVEEAELLGRGEWSAWQAEHLDPRHRRGIHLGPLLGLAEGRAAVRDRGPIVARRRRRRLLDVRVLLALHPASGVPEWHGERRAHFWLADRRWLDVLAARASLLARLSLGASSTGRGGRRHLRQGRPRPSHRRPAPDLALDGGHVIKVVRPRRGHASLFGRVGEELLEFVEEVGSAGEERRDLAIDLFGRQGRVGSTSGAAHILDRPLLLLVGLEDLEEDLVRLRLADEALLDLVDVADGVVELERRPIGAEGGVVLLGHAPEDRGGARRGDRLRLRGIGRGQGEVTPGTEGGCRRKG
jgi:hypothetical protein